MQIVAMEHRHHERNVSHRATSLTADETMINAAVNRGNAVVVDKEKAAQISGKGAVAAQYCGHLMRTAMEYSTRMRLRTPQQLCELSIRTETDS